MSIAADLSLPDFLPWLGMLSSIIAAASVMILYLNYSNQRTKTESHDIELKFANIHKKEAELKEQIKKISELEKKVDDIKGLGLIMTPAERQDIINNIHKKIFDESTDVFLKDLEKKVEQNFIDEILSENIYRSISRLQGEKDSLFKRGNFNLVIGVLISGLGGYMAYLFIQRLPTVGSTIELLSYSFPRISLFVLIALLVFFFLNLYKKSLDDIKYFQNEITNMEAKYLSIQLAKSIKNHKLLSTVLEHLSKTERNFILENGQSTIELEKERINSNNTNSSLELIKDFLKK